MAQSVSSGGSTASRRVTDRRRARIVAALSASFVAFTPATHVPSDVLELIALHFPREQYVAFVDSTHGDLTIQSVDEPSEPGVDHLQWFGLARPSIMRCFFLFGCELTAPVSQHNSSTATGSSSGGGDARVTGSVLFARALVQSKPGGSSVPHDVYAVPNLQMWQEMNASARATTSTAPAAAGNSAAVTGYKSDSKSLAVAAVGSVSGGREYVRAPIIPKLVARGSWVDNVFAVCKLSNNRILISSRTVSGICELHVVDYSRGENSCYDTLTVRSSEKREAGYPQLSSAVEAVLECDATGRGEYFARNSGVYYLPALARCRQIVDSYYPELKASLAAGDDRYRLDHMKLPVTHTPNTLGFDEITHLLPFPEWSGYSHLVLWVANDRKTYGSRFGVFDTETRSDLVYEPPNPALSVSGLTYRMDHFEIRPFFCHLEEVKSIAWLRTRGTTPDGGGGDALSAVYVDSYGRCGAISGGIIEPPTSNSVRNCGAQKWYNSLLRFEDAEDRVQMEYWRGFSREKNRGRNPIAHFHDETGRLICTRLQRGTDVSDDDLCWMVTPRFDVASPPIALTADVPLGARGSTDRRVMPTYATLPFTVTFLPPAPLVSASANPNRTPATLTALCTLSDDRFVAVSPHRMRVWDLSSPLPPPTDLAFSAGGGTRFATVELSRARVTAPPPPFVPTPDPKMKADAPTATEIAKMKARRKHRPVILTIAPIP